MLWTQFRNYKSVDGPIAWTYQDNHGRFAFCLLTRGYLQDY